ncbi:MAG: IclR family transcriptional regulator C-terminal domain-containing protein [Nocardioides sp.]
MTTNEDDDLRSGRSSDFVQSLDRGLAVIRAFDADNMELTLSDVARRTGLPRAAARRFLLTLVELGYLGSNGRVFTPRPRILELGFAYLSSLGLPEVAKPHMEALAQKLHESCSASVLDGGDIVYVARVPARRIMTVAISVGTRFPAYATSMGRVLLAGQSDDWVDGYLASTQLVALTPKTAATPDRIRAIITEVRSTGYCIVDEELELGLRSVAVPIHGANGVQAAINISAHISRGTVEQARKELLPQLLKAAERIEADLAAARPLS